MKKLILLTTLTILSAFSSLGQYSDEELEMFFEVASRKDLINANTAMIKEGSLYHSILVIDKLLEMEPDNANFNYRKGIALFRSSEDFRVAIPFFEKAEGAATADYKFESHKENNAPAEVLYYIGRTHHRDNKLDQANDYYIRYINSGAKDEELMAKARLRQKQLDVAKRLLVEDDYFIVNNVGKTVNTWTQEYSPVISPDGTALYFTSRRLREDSTNIDFRDPASNLYAEDIYVSYKDNDGNWTTPKMLDFCKADNNDATVAVSNDGRKIYVYDGDIGNGDILYSQLEDGMYKDPVPVDIPGLNSDAWETHLSFTPDGNTVFFSSNREGGFGGRDIYRIQKINGEWGEPENLGETVNTPYEECAPFIAMDNATLYFARDGEESIGGFDIFITVEEADGSWSKPRNLGYPINTAGDDLYYTTTADGLTGVMSSFRNEGYGMKDVYEVYNNMFGVTDVAILKGEIDTSDGSQIPEDVGFTVKCLDCDVPFEQSYFPRTSDGTYISALRLCQEYEVTFHYNNKENVFHTENVKTTCDENYEEIFRNVVFIRENLTVIDPNKVISSFDALAMTHFFGYNRNQLDVNDGAMKDFLTAVKEQIDEGRETIELDIYSSASKVPTRTFGDNQKLAELRAKEMEILLKNYFQDESNVKIVVRESMVRGPDYKPGDHGSIEKYFPFQFVKIKVSGINTVADEVKLIQSKDTELKGKVSLESGKTQSMTDEKGDKFSKGFLVESDYRYSIVVGVFRRLEYAESQLKIAKDKGFNEARLLGKKDGRHVVIVGEFNSYKEAMQSLEKARETIDPSSWIYNSKK